MIFLQVSRSRKMITLLKIMCFLWQCLHKSIPIREVLIARGLSIPLYCLVCNAAAESILHTLRDCPQAQAFWGSPPPPQSTPIYSMVQISRTGFELIMPHTKRPFLASVKVLFSHLECGV